MSVARFTPEPHHCAGPRHFVNGGILATLIDCHCVCTAGAAAYRDCGREIGTGTDLHFATVRLELEYLRPTPIAAELELRARILERRERVYVISCELRARDKVRVRAGVDAISVPSSWIAGDRAAG